MNAQLRRDGWGELRKRGKLLERKREEEERLQDGGKRREERGEKGDIYD